MHRECPLELMHPHAIDLHKAMSVSEISVIVSNPRDGVAGFFRGLGLGTVLLVLQNHCSPDSAICTRMLLKDPL